MLIRGAMKYHRSHSLIYVDAAVELTAIDRRVTSRNIARHVGSLKVCTHQDRTRGIRRAGQEALRTPQIQIVTDQPITAPASCPVAGTAAGRARNSNSHLQPA